MLPTDHVKALEGLVDEVERVSCVGIRSLGFGREQSIGEHGRRQIGRNCCEQGALGRVAMAHFCPAR